MSQRRLIDTADIDYAIELSDIYDGVCIWVLKDGTRVNRFAGHPGYEDRAERIEQWMRDNPPETT
jgi:hypothetical protein